MHKRTVKRTHVLYRGQDYTVCTDCVLMTCQMSWCESELKRYNSISCSRRWQEGLQWRNYGKSCLPWSFKGYVWQTDRQTDRQAQAGRNKVFSLV